MASGRSFYQPHECRAVNPQPFEISFKTEKVEWQEKARNAYETLLRNRNILFICHPYLLRQIHVNLSGAVTSVAPSCMSSCYRQLSLQSVPTSISALLSPVLSRLRLFTFRRSSPRTRSVNWSFKFRFWSNRRVKQTWNEPISLWPTDLIEMKNINIYTVQVCFIWFPHSDFVHLSIKLNVAWHLMQLGESHNRNEDSNAIIGN